MIGRSALATVAVVTALVFTASTPASAADNNAIKRAIIVTVLNNLGVEPSPQLIDQLVGDIPMDVLNSSLVKQVGRLLDKSGDPTAVISAAVDSDGDGIPDETAGSTAAASDDDDDDDDDDDETDDDDSSGTTNTGSTNTGTGGTVTNPGSNDDEETDDDDDDEDDEDDEDDDAEDDEDEDDHGGDN